MLNFVLISPEELRIPSYIREDVLKKNNIEFLEVERLEDAIPELDILYMTRVQKERFFNEEDYVRMKGFLHSGQTENGALQRMTCMFFIRSQVLTKFLLKWTAIRELHILNRPSMVYMSVWP